LLERRPCSAKRPTSTVALIETYLGMIGRFLGDRDTALEHYQRALPGLRKVADHGAIAFTLRSIGQIHLARGAHQLAEQYLQEALDTYAEPGPTQGKAQIISWQGMLALEQDQATKAAERFQEALNLARLLGDRPGRAFCLRGLGLAYQQQGKIEQARRVFTEALQLVAQPKPTHMERRIREAIASL
jgi:tetratricopeptide (TPR) repeat protein